MNRFTDELWNRKAAEETGGKDFDEALKGYYYDTYIKITSSIPKDDDIATDLLDDLEKSMLRYAAAVDRHKVSRTKRMDERKSAEQADHDRRIAHESLISDLQILYRYLNTHGIDTTEFDGIINRREDVGQFAIQNADFVAKKRNLLKGVSSEH